MASNPVSTFRDASNLQDITPGSIAVSAEQRTEQNIGSVNNLHFNNDTATAIGPNFETRNFSPPPPYSQSRVEELSTAGVDLPPPSYSEHDIQPYRNSGIEGSSPGQHHYISTEAVLRSQSPNFQPNCSTLTDPNDTTTNSPTSSLQRSGGMSFPKDDEWYVEQPAVESGTSSESSTDEEGSDKDKTEVLAYDAFAPSSAPAPTPPTSTASSRRPSNNDGQVPHRSLRHLLFPIHSPFGRPPPRSTHRDGQILLSTAASEIPLDSSVKQREYTFAEFLNTIVENDISLPAEELHPFNARIPGYSPEEDWEAVREHLGTKLNKGIHYHFNEFGKLYDIGTPLKRRRIILPWSLWRLPDDVRAKLFGYCLVVPTDVTPFQYYKNPRINALAGHPIRPNVNLLRAFCSKKDQKCVFMLDQARSILYGQNDFYFSRSKDLIFFASALGQDNLQRLVLSRDGRANVTLDEDIFVLGCGMSNEVELEWWQTKNHWEVVGHKLIYEGVLGEKELAVKKAAKAKAEAEEKAKIRAEQKAKNVRRAKRRGETYFQTFHREAMEAAARQADEAARQARGESSTASSAAADKYKPTPKYKIDAKGHLLDMFNFPVGILEQQKFEAQMAKEGIVLPKVTPKGTPKATPKATPTGTTPRTHSTAATATKKDKGKAVANASSTTPTPVSRMNPRPARVADAKANNDDDDEGVDSDEDSEENIARLLQIKKEKEAKLYALRWMNRNFPLHPAMR